MMRVRLDGGRLDLAQLRTIAQVSSEFGRGTADTKGEELAFLATRIRSLGADPVVVDVGTRAPTIPPEIGAAAG